MTIEEKNKKLHAPCKVYIACAPEYQERFAKIMQHLHSTLGYTINLKNVGREKREKTLNNLLVIFSRWPLMTSLSQNVNGLGKIFLFD